MEKTQQRGFTLIEMSIVLVIIGLIVGGVLVGQDLVRAAGVRAQISQIEKYNTAVNTFRGKYNALPGDMNAATASLFGFAARGPYAGQGDGNGVIEGNPYNTAVGNMGYAEGAGETVMFWVDLSTAGLIEGGFNTASATVVPGLTITPNSTPSLAAFFPTAKLGGGNYVYVWSGGKNGGDGNNYFGVAGVGEVASNWEMMGPNGNPPAAITVAQAYAIDNKMDDGLPFTGNVTTMELDGGPTWSNNTTGTGGPESCSDNPSGIVGAQVYAMDIKGGAGPNCGLSFRFQ